MELKIKSCIYCGNELAEGRDSFITGCICGQHDAVMCLDCANGDGAKYIDGGYYDKKYNEVYSKKEEPKRPKYKCIFTMAPWYGKVILLLIIAIVTALVYYVSTIDPTCNQLAAVTFTAFIAFITSCVVFGEY